MTLPTLQWSLGAGQGTFETWDTVGIDADVMIQQLVDALPTHFPTVVEFDFYTIFNFADVDAEPAAVAYGTLGQVGTQSPVTTTWQAVQATLTWACVGGFVLKHAHMDSVATPQFEKTDALEFNAAYADLVAAVTSASNGWASRAGTQPLFGKQVAYTLNEKLRREYRLN